MGKSSVNHCIWQVGMQEEIFHLILDMELRYQALRGWTVEISHLHH